MNWKRVRLEEIALIERGKFSARPRNDERFYGGNIPFLQTGDISSSNGTVTSYKQTLNEEGLSVSRLFSAGTLLVTIAANIGDVAEVVFDFACPDSLVAVRPMGENNRIWLKYLLQSKKEFFKSRATQNAQANINLQVIRPMMILLPPLPEQKAIGDLLSTWDEAIEKTEKLIEAKEKQFKWLLNELIGKPATEGREGWRKARLGEICIPITRKNSIGETKVLTSSAKHGLISQLHYYKKSVSGADLSKYYLLRNGDFAYNRSSSNGYPFGATKRLNKYDQGLLSVLYLCFSIISESVCVSDFLLSVFDAGCFNRQLRAICQEGARSHGLLNITKSDFFELSFYLPILEEQNSISEGLRTAQEEIDLLKKMTERYRAQKRWLMQKLLTGDWQVKLEGE